MEQYNTNFMKNFNFLAISVPKEIENKASSVEVISKRSTILVSKVILILSLHNFQEI